MIELAPLEIKQVGFNRYLNEKKRYWKGLVGFLGAMFVALAFSIFTEPYIDNILRVFITVIIVIMGVYYFLRIYNNATRAGRKFLQMWEDNKKEAK